VPKIISESCELVKLFYTNRSGPVFLRHCVVFLDQISYLSSQGNTPSRCLQRDCSG